MRAWDPDVYLRTLRFAAEAHNGQTVPGTTLPYLVHVTLVCMEVQAALRAEPDCDQNLAVQCALLHDVLEDTAVSAERLEAEFGAAVKGGVLALSKDQALPKDQRITDSLHRIHDQPREVWMVKLADRIVNLQQPPAHWDAAKIAHYREDALTIHAQLQGASPTLAARLLAKIENYNH
ncbi:MAG: HD domain-containing protein [Vicinamibacteria bacterium]|jgi:(p)ppGpp synthase/HD superfamily hydrolase|nr:HD domain-containing protein [Vicinamibacteria bacterium]